MPDEEIDYKRLYEQEKKKVFVLEQRLGSFELPSKAKLFYSLNKQQNDLADKLNTVKISDIDISSTSDKSIERLEKIWKAIGILSPIVDSLRVSAGVTGDEDKDMAARKPFVDTIAESRD